MRSERLDAGMATAELAAALPVLLLVVTAALGGVTVSGARVRAQDAAREAARAAARSASPAVAANLADRTAPGVRLSIARDTDAVTVTATLRVRPVRWLPAVTITERAIAATEPRPAAAERTAAP